MLRLFNRFLIFVVLVTLVLYLVVLNRETATLRLGSTWQVTAAAGFLYIGILFAGFLLAFLVALVFGARMYFKERRLLAQERRRQSFEHSILEARGYLASGEWQKARDLWQQIIRKDPDNVIARVELSRSFEGSGDVAEALRVLDSTRASFKNNTEVLFRAAELNLASGNRTAALDNLGLLLQSHPSSRAARMARDLAEDLGKLEDALEYQSQVEQMAGADKDSETVRSRLTFKRLLRDTEGDKQRLKEGLSLFIKKHPTFEPALAALAAVRQEEGNLDDAAELLVRGAKVARSPEKWERVAALWLKDAQGDPQRRAERAISAVRAAAVDARGFDRIRAELTLAATLLSVNKLDDGRKVLDAIPSLAEKEGLQLSGDIRQRYLALRGLCLSRLGFEREAAEIWPQLVEGPAEMPMPQKAWAANGRAPSPVFSTP